MQINRYQLQCSPHDRVIARKHHQLTQHVGQTIDPPVYVLQDTAGLIGNILPLTQLDLRLHTGQRGLHQVGRVGGTALLGIRHTFDPLHQVVDRGHQVSGFHRSRVDIERIQIAGGAGCDDPREIVKWSDPAAYAIHDR